MASKISINLDTCKENFIPVKCKQNDDLTLEAFIYENGLELNLTNKEITIQALKSDNTYIIQNTSITKENNKIVADLIRDFSRIAGKTEIEIVLTESSKQNTTFSFCLEVVGSVIRGAVQSSNTATILEALDNKIIEAGQVKQETEELVQSGGAATKGEVQEINASLEQKEKQVDSIDKTMIKPLYINTFDGAGDCLHPSVCFVEGGVGTSIRRYWMAYTPLTNKSPYVDRWECPCIAFSEDGVTWYAPSLTTNPIDNLTTEEITNKDYFSDPYIFYNNITSKLEIWYRYTYRNNEQRTIIYRKTSTDGIAWSERELILDTSINNIFGTSALVSPQIIFDGNYYNLYLRTSDSVNTIIRCGKSTLNAPNVFTDVKNINFIGLPNYYKKPWHFGLFYDGTTYHMTGYEGGDGGVLYYTSNDGVSFKYEGVSLSYNSQQTNLRYGLYQSIPLKVNNKWLLYATVKIKYYYQKMIMLKNTITLFSGDNLLNLSNVDGGSEFNRKIYNNDILLANSKGVNAPTNGYSYLTYEDAVGNERYGYGMDLSKNTPTWIDGAIGKKRSIPIVIKDIYAPYVVPTDIGQIWIDTAKFKVWVSVGTGNLSDWRYVSSDNEFPQIVNLGSVVNKKLTGFTCNSTLSALNQYNLAITTNSSSNTIEYITDGIDKQEIIILNIAPSSITLKHALTQGEGHLRLRGQVDRVLKNSESIRLIKYSNFWFEN